jgi:hypothetical protein
LVDKSALEGLPEEERKRQEAIFELITTEGLYVRDLQLIVEVFYSNLMSLLDQKAITVVFANIEDILLTSTVRDPLQLCAVSLMGISPIFFRRSSALLRSGRRSVASTSIKSVISLGLI